MSDENEIDPTIGLLELTRETSELREPSEAATCSVASARPDDPYSQLLHRGADDEVADDGDVRPICCVARRSQHQS